MQATNHLTGNRAERMKGGLLVTLQVGIRPGSRVTLDAGGEIVTVLGGDHETCVCRFDTGYVTRTGWTEIGLPGFEQPKSLDRPSVSLDLIDHCNHLIDAWQSAEQLEKTPASAPSEWIERIKAELVDVCERIAKAG